ncbi:MAG TPA: lipopolysaccharide kinase InaA family protein [Phycisphaerae bacterium]|nr:lipopolysaccharide kinase InaA family protein [Phycisphaerae bacterium]
MGEIFWINPEDRILLSTGGLDDLPSFFAWRQGDRLDKVGLASWRQRWRLRLTDCAGRERVMYLKRFQNPPLGRQLDRWKLGRPLTATAAIEWQNALQLQALGVRAATPVGFGQQMAGPWERRSFVLLDAAQGESLERWVPRQLAPQACERDLSARRAMFDALARFVAGFHAAGFVHRDMYLCHIFIRGAERGYPRPAHGDCFTLIDLQRVFRPRWRQRRWVVKDLAALNFSAPVDRVGRWERLRFLCRYARAHERVGSARLLARLIGRKTAEIARRNPAPLAGEWSPPRAG